VIPNSVDEEESLYRESLSLLRSPKPPQTSLAFVILFVIFVVGQMGEMKSLEGIVLLIGVLFFHEAGHALGMRLFGFRDVRMFFIPFFGAAVSGRPRGVTAAKQALVSLLGPLPGIVVAVVLTLIPQRDPLVTRVAEVMLILNAFNLLPFGGLDGGRFFQTVIFSRHRVLEILFQTAGSLALAWLAVSASMWMLLVFALFGLVMLPMRWRVLGAAQAVRQAFPSLPRDPEALDELHASWLFNQARGVLQGKARSQPQPIANLMEAMLDATQPPPRALASVGLVSLYVVAVVLALVGVVTLAGPR
jgi:Zn-dependent protease